MGWWIHVLLLASYPLVIGLMGADRAELAPPALGRGAKALLVVTAAELLIFGIVFTVAWRCSRATGRQMYLTNLKPVTQLPLGLAYSVGLRVALAVVVAFAAALLIATGVLTPSGLQEFVTANRPDVSAIVDISVLKNDRLYFWLTVTLVSFVMGGLREELWRGGLLAGMAVLWPGRFGSRAGQLGAALVAAVIFGLGHTTQGFLAVFVTGLLGLGLGVLVVLHRSIWPAVWAHGFFNATSLALLPWLSDHLPGV